MYLSAEEAYVEPLRIFPFDSDMANPLLKTKGRRDRRFNVVIFMVWSALIVGRWLVVAWGEKYCFALAEISSLVLLDEMDEFKDETLCESSREKDVVIIRRTSLNAAKLR